MPKVITLTGLQQASALKGWDACKPIEARDSSGQAIVRCAGPKAMTLSGHMSDKEATKRASRKISKSGQGLKCDDSGHCVLSGTAKRKCTRKAISSMIKRAKRALKAYECEYAADMMYEISQCKGESGIEIKGTTWKAMSSRVRNCHRKQAGRQRTLRA